MPPKERKRTLHTSATIAAAAFNLPVMVIAGVIIGYLLSVNQNSPLRELILIGSPILFFVIAIFELYYVVNRQQIQRSHPRSSFSDLAKLITEEGERKEEGKE
ncbi:MAG: hypothetical protein JSW11_21995 [Candidatus Heimdallarchaeota archaeon]|nr:MAG: hypothetical protein JSW11_21995 [Candidatus Heimdallarchaeota archaeon]